MNYHFYQFILYLSPTDVGDSIVFSVRTETFTNIKCISKILKADGQTPHTVGKDLGNQYIKWQISSVFQLTGLSHPADLWPRL